MTKEQPKLRVVSADFRAILGITELSLEPGKVTLIKGRNQAGKSSILKSIQAALGRGNIMHLKNVNAADDTKPEVVIVLKGDEREYRIRRKGDKLNVKSRVSDTAAFEDIKSPQAWLSGLFDAQGCNPIAFKQADNKTKALMILEALTLDLDREALWSAMGIDKKDLPPIPEGGHPLQELAWIRETIYRERTGVNRDAGQKHASAEQLKREMPTVVPDASERIEKLEHEIHDLGDKLLKASVEIESERDLAKEQSTAAFRDEVNCARNRYELMATQKRAELEAELSKQKDSLERDIATWRENFDTETGAFDLAYDMKRTDIKLTEEEELIPRREELAALKATQDNVVKAKALSEQAEQFEADSEALKERSEQLTVAIKALDDYRANLAKDLPIAGLDISNNVVTVDSIPIDQLNDGQQLEIGVQIAVERARKFPLPHIYIDGFEQLDLENQNQLIKRLYAEKDIQVFIGCVAETDQLEVQVA